MRTLLRRWAGAAITITVCAGVFQGCDSGKPAKPTATSSSNVSNVSGSQDQESYKNAMGHEGEDHSRGSKLSKEDLALAAAQKFCPVSDEELGGDMGPPVKLTVKGETIFICCQHCKEKIDADPDKYLAKVAELLKANAEEAKPEEEKP